jgi:hypothetical protein
MDIFLVILLTAILIVAGVYDLRFLAWMVSSSAPAALP